MRLKKVAELLSNELHVHLTLSRLLRYSERGILPHATYDNQQVRDYQPADVDRIRTTVVLAELGIALPDVRTFHQDPAAIQADIRRRIEIVKELTTKAEQLIGVATNAQVQMRTDTTN